MPKFLSNIWYVAAWADEVAENLLARTILSKHLVLYRKSDGQVVAMDDRCPHRFAPLHMGNRVGDHIECSYHGLRFDCSGRCVFNPHGNGEIPKKAMVQTYPLVERYGLLWIWMGDKDRADQALIPEFSFLTDPTFQNVKGYTLAEGHYELMTDNIMDLGHIEFLHPGPPGKRCSTSCKGRGHSEWKYGSLKPSHE
jgi:phenylpropionate dioxygenase-like ring-hydroxylating dioxygenase large terminal subunit